MFDESPEDENWKFKAEYLKSETWYEANETFFSNGKWRSVFSDKNSNLQKHPPEVFCKKMFLEISQNSQEKTCVRVIFFIVPLRFSDVFSG